MKYFKILLLVLIFSTVNACYSVKSNTESGSPQVINKEVKNEVEKEMLEAGYRLAYVVYNKGKEAPCEYLIQVGDDLLLEPMHALKSEYKIEKLPIWIKYHMQRRMNRCGTAQPVEIVAIEKR